MVRVALAIISVLAFLSGVQAQGGWEVETEVYCIWVKNHQAYAVGDKAVIKVGAHWQWTLDDVHEISDKEMTDKWKKYDSTLTKAAGAKYGKIEFKTGISTVVSTGHWDTKPVDISTSNLASVKSEMTTILSTLNTARTSAVAKGGIKFYEINEAYHALYMDDSVREAQTGGKWVCILPEGEWYDGAKDLQYNTNINDRIIFDPTKVQSQYAKDLMKSWHAHTDTKLVGDMATLFERKGILKSGKKADFTKVMEVWAHFYPKYISGTPDKNGYNPLFKDLYWGGKDVLISKYLKDLDCLKTVGTANDIDDGIAHKTEMDAAAREYRAATTSHEQSTAGDKWVAAAAKLLKSMKDAATKARDRNGYSICLEHYKDSINDDTMERYYRSCVVFAPAKITAATNVLPTEGTSKFWFVEERMAQSSVAKFPVDSSVTASAVADLLCVTKCNDFRLSLDGTLDTARESTLVEAPSTPVVIAPTPVVVKSAKQISHCPEECHACSCNIQSTGPWVLGSSCGPCRTKLRAVPGYACEKGKVVCPPPEVDFIELLQSNH